MVLDFLLSLGPVNLVVISAALVVFVYWFKNLVSLVKGAFFVGIASAIFPVVATKFFGFDFPLNLETLLNFVVLGLGLYFIFMFGKTVYKILSISGKSVSFLMGKSQKKTSKKDSDPYHSEDKEEKSVIKKFRRKNER